MGLHTRFLEDSTDLRTLVGEVAKMATGDRSAHNRRVNSKQIREGWGADESMDIQRQITQTCVIAVILPVMTSRRRRVASR
jgi:hypothetical protein